MDTGAVTGTGRLLEEARGGSQEAWRVLYDRYRVSLLLAVQSQIPSLQGRGFDAEDVVQSAFLSAWQKILSFEYKGEGSFRRWLRRIVLNNVVDRFRAERPLSTEVDSFHLESPTAAETPTGALQESEDERALLDRLSQLDEIDQEILVMRDFEKKRWREIVDILDRPYSTVRRRYANAWNELARSIRS